MLARAAAFSKGTTVKEIAIIAAFAVTPLAGLAMFWLSLRFLWKVYQRGGASDLSEAARSLLLARGIQPGGQTSSHDDPSPAGSGRSAAATARDAGSPA